MKISTITVGSFYLRNNGTVVRVIKPATSVHCGYVCQVVYDCFGSTTDETVVMYYELLCEMTVDKHSQAFLGLFKLGETLKQEWETRGT